MGYKYKLRRIKPKKKFKVNKRYVIMLCVFASLALAYQVSGLQPITGFATLESPANSTGASSSITIESAALRVSPEFITLEAHPNQTTTAKLSLSNTGTIPLQVQVTAHGSVFPHFNPIKEFSLTPNTSKTLDAEFQANQEPGEIFGALSIKSEHGRTAIPVEITVSDATSESVGGGGDSSITGTYPRLDSIKLTPTLLTPLSIYLNLSTSFNITIENPTKHLLQNPTLSLNASGLILSAKPPNTISPKTSVTISANLSTTNNSCLAKTSTLFFNSSTFQHEVQIKIYANGLWTSGGVYHNRTMPKSPSYEVVPVPGASFELSEACAGYTPPRTGQLGTFRIFRPAKPTNLTVTAPGFLVSKKARKELGARTETAQFLIDIGKAKLSVEPLGKLTMGISSEVTYAASVAFPDTVLPGHKHLKDVELELVLIKEFGEEVYELSNPVLSYHNLSEGTQYIKANITIPSDLSSRDLNLPKLRARLKTSTTDIIYEKTEKATIGFLLAELWQNNCTGNITIHNPTGRQIKGVTLSSELTNEFGNRADVLFSKNLFSLGTQSTQTIPFEVTNAEQGNYTGHISVAGTLPPKGSWDDPAADLLLLSARLNVPVHDVSILSTTPLVLQPGAPITVLVQNHRDFNESVSFSLALKNFTCSDTISLGPHETLKYTPPCQPPLTPGANNLSAAASISLDYKPRDNSQNFSVFVTANEKPRNTVLLIFDGLGYFYLNRDETPTFKSLEHMGAGFTNMRTRIASTTESHSTLFTSQYKEGYDYKAFSQTVALPNNTLFDSARAQGYLTLGVMGQGDTFQAAAKMDAILWDTNNDWERFDSDLSVNANISPELFNVLQAHNNLPDYLGKSGCTYCDYDQWTTDSVTAILEEMARSGDKFILTVNFAGTDHGGHAGPSEYFETKSAADAQLKQILDTLLQTSLMEDTILIVTADHGMCFREGSYGEYGYHASCADEPAYRVPFTVLGPGVQAKPATSLAYLDDATPTIEELLTLRKQPVTTGIVRSELLGDYSDVGVEQITTPDLIVGVETITNITLKNYGLFTQDVGVCFNVSGNSECRDASLQPATEQTLTYSWTPLQSGVYKPLTYLTTQDANPHNNLLRESKSAGVVNDLGIGKIWYDLTDYYYNNLARKIELTIHVCNNGNTDFNDKLMMRIWTEGCTENFCNKTYNKKFSAKIGKCNKYKSAAPFGLGTGFQSINFQILNTTDADSENNAYTRTTYNS